MRKCADREAFAFFPGLVAWDLLDRTSDPSALDSEGFWVVVLSFEGRALFAKFGRVQRVSSLEFSSSGGWIGPSLGDWQSSMTREQFEDGVRSIRESIARGDVYQVNLTRRLSAPLECKVSPDALRAFSTLLDLGNPAPHAATVLVPSAEIAVVSASPESFLAREGSSVRSSPIKGTARLAKDLTDKDFAENVMIVDLVRNDLGRVCEWGSVRVPSLCRLEPHPGLVHLVSTIEGRLASHVRWGDLLEATFPPGSVTGAPKLAAMRIIEQREPVPRGIYCGSVGWVDADTQRGELNVAIRTFWVEDGALHFGTGGGITWDSVPRNEWNETELKASRLLGLASSGSAVTAGRRMS